MDLMSLITGGAQPQPTFDDRFGAANPNLENLLRAIAMQRMQSEPQPQGFPEAAPAAGFQPGGMPNMMPDMSMAGGPGPAPAAPISMPPDDGKWPTEFGGRARSPNDIPLLRPDPREVNVSSQRIIRAPDAPPEFPIGMPMQAQPSMQDMLPTPRSRTMNNALSGFAAGIAKMPGNTRGSALGRGFGGAVAGADAGEQQDFNNSVKVLDAVDKMKLAKSKEEYNAAYVEYLRSIAAKNRADTAPERMIARIQESYKARTGQDLPYDKAYEVYKSPQFQERMAAQERIGNQRNASAEARAEFNANSRDLTMRDKPSMDNLVKKRQGAYGTNAPRGEQPAQKPAEIDMKGNGSQANPYKPTSDAEYNDMPVGTYYQHPSDPPGKLRIKGKGPA